MSGVALGLPMRRGHGRALGVFGGRITDGAGLGAVDGGGSEAGGADAGASEVEGVGVADAVGGAGVGVEVIAICPLDASKRGDISQPPTATLRTTRAIRKRRAAWFTRVEDATCRPHHSASR